MLRLGPDGLPCVWDQRCVERSYIAVYIRNSNRSRVRKKKIASLPGYKIIYLLYVHGSHGLKPLAERLLVSGKSSIVISSRSESTHNTSVGFAHADTEEA